MFHATRKTNEHSKKQKLILKRESYANKHTSSIQTMVYIQFFYFPSWMEKKLHHIIFNYLWNSKPDPIKTDVIFLPLIEGGLGLIHPKTQNQALRIKFLFQITDTKTKDTWVYFARYWLSSKLAKYNEAWDFLTKNSKPKQIIGKIPSFYENLLKKFEANHEKLISIKNKTTKYIYIYVTEKRKLSKHNTPI